MEQEYGMTKGYGMSMVTVKRDDLVAKLKTNRDGHRAIFEEALTGYKDKVVAELERHLQEVRAGKVRVIAVSLPEPSDHTRDYDRIISMCEMSVDEELELTQDEFASYVMDDWQWKRQFLSSNAGYSQTARTQLQ
jgi:hypothetical protein